LFHMPVIMLNRLFRLPQTKNRVYPNRSFLDAHGQTTLISRD
jgi:hypothetical protein